MREQRIELRRVKINSTAARGLTRALDAALLGLYPEEGTPLHLQLEDEEVAPGRGVFLVAYMNDNPSGCGAIRLLDADTAEVKRLYVQPEARRAGLGRRLMESLEAEARTLGARRMVLETGPRQPEALGLFSNTGFERTTAFGGYEDHPLSIFMGKTL
ncbi:GNAT family N-acetyltransferase [Candidatus Neomarinimicrobiota bacterium]